MDPEQETEPRFQLPGMTEDDEFICFERVNFRALQPNAEYPLGQPGKTEGAIMFDHLATGEENPYTRANLLAICPSCARQRASRCRREASMETAAVPDPRRTRF